jgi:hypothetical protein
MTDWRDEHEPYGFTESSVIKDLQNKIERLIAERDEARRMWCEAEAVGNCLSVDDMKRRARTEAKRREWDCYKDYK